MKVAHIVIPGSLARPRPRTLCGRNMKVLPQEHPNHPRCPRCADLFEARLVERLDRAESALDKIREIVE